MNWYEILPTLMNMTLTASIVIIFVLLLRLVLRKAPKQYSYILWMIVLFRLLCPITISSPVSLLNLFDTPVTETGSMEYVPVDIVHSPNPAISLPSKTVNDAVNAVLPQSEEQLRADPLEAPITILTYIWLLGMVTMLGYSLVQFTALRAKLVCAVEIDKRIFLADYIDTSFVIGILHPRVYLPSALSETEQTYILMHERYHIRRLDHIVKLFAFAALCIHWFNPLVWFAFILFGKDMEMSCDEAVMRGMEGDIRAAYAQSLLRFATGKRIIAGAPLAFGEGDTKDRVKNVMRYRKPALWIGIAAVIVCAAAAAALSTNPMEKTGEAVIPATRDEIARTIYGVSQVIYDAPMFSFVLTPANAPLYMISDTMELHSDEITQFSDGETENGFILRGTMTEVKLSKENFDDLFEELDYLPWTNDRAAQLRKDNEKTWRVDDLINPNDVFYYILKQKNGDIYLSYGYDDPAGETDPASDDSMIRWLMQLEPLDAMVSDADDPNLTDYRVYTCFDSPDPFDKPTLMLSADGFHFRFFFSLLSSYIPVGTYELNDTQLILRTDDELERIYVFDIVGDTYVFNASLSSRIPTYQYESGGDSKCPVPDGAIFASKAQGEAQEVASETIDEPLPAETTAGPIEITNYYERIPMPIDETYDPFEDAVAEAIHARYRPDDPDGLIHTESHVVLANAIACGVGLFGAEEKGVSEEILYTIVMHKRYSTYGGELKEEGGSIVPTYLRFRIEDHGKITLLEYWEPRDGRYYAEDIRNKFPDFASVDALNHQQYVAQLDAQCRSKALAILQNAGHIDDHIASLLEIICSSPAYASDPAAYIKEHDVEYAELINYSQYTLRYCFSQFIQGMQTDLRGHIMAAVCKEILSELGEPFAVASTPISTGQDWFDAFRIHAQETIEQYDIKYLEKYCPGTFLYLNLVKEV